MWDKTETKVLMKITGFYVKIVSFHLKTKDHLQGIVTPMILYLGG